MGRDGGDGVEVLRVHEATNGFVVIATHKQVAQRSGLRNDFIGACAVTNNIAQIHDNIVSGSGGQTSFESFEIGVNIA